MSAYIVAARPWTSTATLVPIAVTAALLQRLGAISGNAGDIWLLIAGALAIHAGANLVNTYFDFVNGVDDEGADDDTLVRKVLPPSHVFGFGIACLLLGVAVTVYFCAVIGLKCLMLAIPALFIAYTYTAGPLPLKYMALGDVAILIAFGPLTSLSAYLALARVWTSVAWWALIYSCPVAFHTEAILHANNVRDIGRDTKAGVKTLASKLPFAVNLQIYILLILLPYALTCLLAFTHGWRLLLVFLVSPVALRLVNGFRAHQLQVLPQKTAQHNLLFGLLLAIGLLFP